MYGTIKNEFRGLIQIPEVSKGYKKQLDLMIDNSVSEP